jgi:phosphoribosyl 1,2-cyclic phosphodiesterase
VHIISIGSSSSGNSTLIYNDSAAILVDSGIPVKQVLEKTGRKEFTALLISHEHSDHIKTAGALSRKAKVPIYISDLAAQKWKTKHSTDFEGCTLHNMTDTSVLQFGNITVKGFSTKHDAAHALGFIFEEPGTKFCYLTDTGSVSKAMFEAIKDCDSYFIECDYDEEMIKAYEGYAQDLKDRITSNFGHLSTQQVLDLVQELGVDRARKFFIGHLSDRTNSPEKVLERLKDRYPQHINKFIIAPFDGAVEL